MRVCFEQLGWMPSLYADRHLKSLVQRRRDAMSDPDNGNLVSEKEVLIEMLDDQYTQEYQRMKGEDAA